MANEIPETNNQQKRWNFWATLFYILCVAGLGFTLDRKEVSLADFTLGNIILMILATYRLTRILVFDKIFKLFRDFFRTRQRLYFFFVIKEIITCPWCAGVWVALVIVAIFFLVPYGELFVVLLGISGVATFVVILVNYIGLSTEEKQFEMKEKTRDSDYTKIS